MAYVKAGDWSWASSPTISGSIYYDKRRSGTTQQYKIKYVINTLQYSSSYFGYYIAARTYLDGTLKDTHTIKNNDPSQWSSAIEYETGWLDVANKTSGTATLRCDLYTNSGRADKDISYTLAITPANSDLGNISNFVIGNTISIPVTKYDSTYYDKLEVLYNSNVIATRNGFTSGNFSFSQAELNSIYSAMSSTNSGTFTFRLTTYTSSAMSTSLGNTTKTATGSITNANPTFADNKVTYADTNSTTVTVTQNNQKMVQGLSTLVVTIAAATGNKGASITNYSATINGVTLTRSSAGTLNFGAINSSNNLELKVTATDSRGNTTTVKKTVTFLAWVLPSANISLRRLNNFEDTTYLKVKGTFSSVDNKNVLTIKYQYKKTTDANYSAETTIADNTQITLTCNKNYAWDFKIKLSDKFGTATYNVVLAKGKFIVFYDVNKLSVGINGFPTHNEAFEVFGDLYLNGAKIIESR